MPWPFHILTVTYRGMIVTHQRQRPRPFHIMVIALVAGVTSVVDWALTKKEISVTLYDDRDTSHAMSVFTHDRDDTSNAMVVSPHLTLAYCPASVLHA